MLVRAVPRISAGPLAVSPDWAELVAAPGRRTEACVSSTAPPSRPVRELHRGGPPSHRRRFQPGWAAGCRRRRGRQGEGLVRANRSGCFRTFAGHTDALTGVEFSADGSRIVTSSRDWTPCGSGMSRPAASTPLRGHFGPVFGGLVQPGRTTRRHGRAEHGRPLGGRERPADLVPAWARRSRSTAASFSPDGSRILSSSRDGTVRTYACEVCGGLDALVRTAQSRLWRRSNDRSRLDDRARDAPGERGAFGAALSVRAQLCQEVLHHFRHRRVADHGAGERKCSGSEDLRARRRLVVGHLCGQARPRRFGISASTLYPARRGVGRSCRSRSRRCRRSSRPSVPCREEPWRGRDVRTIQGRGAFRRRCRGTGRRSGPPRAGQVAPLLRPLITLPCASTRQKKLFAERNRGCRRVAVALDDVVLVRRDVLVVAREDDQVVGAAECCALADWCRGRRPRGCRPRGRSRRPSAGTAGRSGGSGRGRRDRGTGGEGAWCGFQSAYQVSPLPSPLSSRRL